MHVEGGRDALGDAGVTDLIHQVWQIGATLFGGLFSSRRLLYPFHNLPLGECKWRETGGGSVPLLF